MQPEKDIEHARPGQIDPLRKEGQLGPFQSGCFAHASPIDCCSYISNTSLLQLASWSASDPEYAYGRPRLRLNAGYGQLLARLCCSEPRTCMYFPNRHAPAEPHRS